MTREKTVVVHGRMEVERNEDGSPEYMARYTAADGETTFIDEDSDGHFEATKASSHWPA